MPVFMLWLPKISGSSIAIGYRLRYSYRLVLGLGHGFLYLLGLGLGHALGYWLGCGLRLVAIVREP